MRYIKLCPIPPCWTQFFPFCLFLQLKTLNTKKNCTIFYLFIFFLSPTTHQGILCYSIAILYPVPTSLASFLHLHVLSLQLNEFHFINTKISAYQVGEESILPILFRKGEASECSTAKWLIHKLLPNFNIFHIFYHTSFRKFSEHEKIRELQCDGIIVNYFPSHFLHFEAFSAAVMFNRYPSVWPAFSRFNRMH